MNGLLMQTATPPIAGFSRHGGAIWNSLQELKEEISMELLNDGPLCQSQPENSYGEGAADLEIGLRHRSQLEQRLVEITDAQDRLLDGTYGKCVECQVQVSPERLSADPAVSLCLDCQMLADGEHDFPTM